MITVEQATDIILQHVFSFGEEIVPFNEARGRVLRETLVADRDFPPFDRVSMDGIAIRHEAFAAGQRTFFIEGIQAAGMPPLVLMGANNCLETMTGAVLPQHTDTVVRYEDLEIREGKATILTEDVTEGQNIHRQGTDRRQGETIVQAGRKVAPGEIGVAATIGKTSLQVAALPNVAVISSGDELVEVGDLPLPHQIRRSNVHSLAAALAAWGVRADLLHLRDDREEIEALLSGCLEKYDALILSGGVSMGKFDFLPTAFEALGVRELFHKVAQRPGKPFWFGRGDQTAVFALPGNPVSTFVCLHRYFRPWLRACMGEQPFKPQYAVLETDFFFKPALTYFLQVKLAYREDGVTVARPIAGKGSGDLANLADADAFLELPADRQDFKKGEAFPVIMYR